MRGFQELKTDVSIENPLGKACRKEIPAYTLLFLVAAVCCYAFFIITGTTFIKYSAANVDGLTQHYPAYVALKHMIKDLLAGGGFDSWSWSLGLGGDTFEYFGFKLFNPLTYLIIAFPEDLIDVGYSIANVIRQYLAGLTFLFCMREVKLPSVARITGALSYAFCGWLVSVLFNQGSFENIAIIFPLLVMGTEKIFKKKSPVLFIVAVALTVASGVTWTYISGIAIVAYYFARYHDYHKGENAIAYLKNTGEYMLYGIVGILIASPFILSILCSMGGATTGTGAEYNIWTYALNKYLMMPAGLFKYGEVTATSYSHICVSAACICLMPILIKQIKKKSTIAMIAVAYALLSLIPLTSIIFNGMSYPAGRWHYVLMFFIIWATMECFNEETLSDRSNLVLMGIWVAALELWNIAMYFLHIESIGTLLMVSMGAACCFALLLLAYCYYVAKRRKPVIAVLACVVFLASIIYPAGGRTCPLLGDYLSEYMTAGQSAEMIETTPERVVAKINDDSFYRSDQTYRINSVVNTKMKVNANMVYDNKSIYIYSSLLDSKWSAFNKAVGNNAGYFYRTAVISNDNRAPLDYLFGVKYFLGNNKYEKNASDYAGYGYRKTETIDGVEILKNEHCIGLGTAFDKYITESEWMEYPQMVRDQVLLQAVVIPDEDEDSCSGMTHASEADIHTSISAVNVGLQPKKNISIDETNRSFTVSGGTGVLTIDCPRVQNVQLALSFEGLSRHKHSYDAALELKDSRAKKGSNSFVTAVNRKSYRDHGEFRIITKFNGLRKYAYCDQGSPRGFNDIENYNINLGYFDNAEGKIEVKFNTPGVYTYDAIKLYAIPMDVLDENAEQLEATSLKIESYSGDSVRGTVATDEESMLFLSIPFDKGWRAYVDGEKTATLSNVDIGFTGVRIPAGEHQLELCYSHWGMKAALGGTLLGIIGLIIIIIRRRKNG